MTYNLADRIFEFFGSYYKRIDSYKDGDGKGIFERFQEIIGEDADVYLITPEEDAVKNLLTPDDVQTKYFDFLANHIGCSLKIGSSVTTRIRRMFRVIMSLFGLRGLEQNYTWLFDLLPIEFIAIHRIHPDVPKGFDSPVELDDTDRKFDSCDTVVDLTCWIELEGTLAMTEELLLAIQNIIVFNTPFYITIGYIMYNGTIYIFDTHYWVTYYENVGYVQFGYSQRVVIEV